MYQGEATRDQICSLYTEQGTVIYDNQPVAHELIILRRELRSLRNSVLKSAEEFKRGIGRLKEQFHEYDQMFLAQPVRKAIDSVVQNFALKNNIVGKPYDLNDDFVHTCIYTAGELIENALEATDDDTVITSVTTFGDEGFLFDVSNSGIPEPNQFQLWQDVSRQHINVLLAKDPVSAMEYVQNKLRKPAGGPHGLITTMAEMPMSPYTGNGTVNRIIRPGIRIAHKIEDNRYRVFLFCLQAEVVRMVKIREDAEATVDEIRALFNPIAFPSDMRGRDANLAEGAVDNIFGGEFDF